MSIFVKPLAVIVVALLALGSVGCARRALLPTAPPEPKPDAGSVGLAVAPGSSTASVQRPGAVGAGHGAKEGAKKGAIVPIVPGIVFTVLAAEAREPYSLVAGLMLIGAGIVLAPVGAGIGAAIGAIAAPSQEKVERCATGLARAFADAEFSRALTARIIEAAHPRPVVPVAEPESLVVDTRLEIEAPEVSLASKDPTDWTPELRLLVSIRAKLVRASDGEELRTFAWEQEGPKATFFEWGKDDARMFRAELERAGRALAAKVIADLY